MVLVKDGAGPEDPGVRIATTHAMKGLEFRCVAVVGASATAFPFGPAVAPEEADRLQHASDLLAALPALRRLHTRPGIALRLLEPRAQGFPAELTWGRRRGRCPRCVGGTCGAAAHSNKLSCPSGSYGCGGWRAR